MMKKKLKLFAITFFALFLPVLTATVLYESCTKETIHTSKQETTIDQSRSASCAVPITWKIEKKFLLGTNCIVVSVKDVYTADHIYYLEISGPSFAPGFFAYTFIEPTANIPGNYVRWYTPASYFSPGLYFFKIKTVCNYDGSLCNTGSCQYSNFSTVKTFLVN